MKQKVIEDVTCYTMSDVIVIKCFCIGGAKECNTYSILKKIFRVSLVKVCVQVYELCHYELYSYSAPKIRCLLDSAAVASHLAT